MTNQSRNASQKRVYSGLSEGAKVRFEQYHPGSGRQPGVGEIVDVNEDPPTCAFTKYKVEYDHGFSWVAANDITDVLQQ